MRRLTVTYKMTVLLALLSTAPIILYGIGGQSGETTELLAQQRVALCEEVAVGSSLHLRRQDYQAVKQQMEQFAERVKTVSSLRMKRFDGLLIAETGDHDAHWKLKEDELANLSNLRVPILRNGRQWGTLEVAFSQGIDDGSLWKLGRAVLLALSMNALSFGLLLRRSLSVLDPGTAVPRRVRNTLDTLAGGVVILDGQRRIVLANETFQKSCGVECDKLIGQSLDRFNWRVAEGQTATPWVIAMESRSRCSGATVFMVDATGDERCFVVNATPVLDTEDRLAGTLVSFEDITLLEKQKQTLMETLTDLERSREKIHEQNIRLQELASRDALTGASNRRALFEQLERMWDDHLNHQVAMNCIMLDVDHFKRLNDTHGHFAGDQVLKEVARVLSSTVGDVGVVGRYGGEEFCIAMPGCAVETAIEMAEKVRKAISEHLADPYKVTASFGVSCAAFGASSFQSILEQADEGLYAAKRGGRNCTRCWSEQLAAENEAENTANAKRALARSNVDQPISYHAVTSLHAALAYRDAETALHSQRVAEMSVSLARGLMSVSELYILEIAGLLHDIGKIGVPDAVLLKPDKLNQDEWKIMEAHARMGVEIIESSFSSPSLADIVRFHHYRYDGGNTPKNGPVGKQIPLGARIVCIVDAFDAMVSDRVYRKGRPAEAAFEELRRCAATQFDPDLVERFIDMQVGWRPDSRFYMSHVDDRLAVQIGHLTERTLYAYETHDAKSLADTLKQLSTSAKQYDSPAIVHLANELEKAVSERDQTSWQAAMPILQNLLDMCLTVQREHVRDVASRPRQVENCPQQNYFSSN